MRTVVEGRVNRVSGSSSIAGSAPDRPSDPPSGRMQVIYMTSARVFALSRANLTGPDMAQWYVTGEAKIVAAALGASGPYVMSVNSSYGLRRVKLAYPPD